ncbi:zinc finger protein 518A isoform X2 [Colossoma macropomum]|nr:zinc finger protein 518A isoform X2 [Colossoma macropomum]XP_036430465.1 zinc finger protein 518A isoform X2 [Colossoma macropomum]XP_036430466.1 zinc finger protein 518A isoform X2 [Colossoma macropomum]XP_036430467.1 zinc finger protein 518A isoform X2 [Colossoma macropomum]XP_036430468.1 zinc finger protein 518A isoform X2 [Colossoma macropomum]
MEHTNPSSHPEDANHVDDNERGNWHRRLRLRKSSASSLTVKSTTEEEKVVIKPQKMPSQNERQTRQVVNSSSSKLTFTCSDCKDNTKYCPHDLLNHFSVFHGGKGDPPTFPCDICSFATPEFTILQQHRMKHKQCRLSCEICNDNVLQTLSQLKKHCKTQHSLNGQYHCGKCSFSTKELKSFVHHPCPTRTESPIDSTEKSGIKPMNGELNGNHLDADGAPQKEELLQPMATDCRQGWRRKNWWKKRDSLPKPHSINTPDLKALLTKPETQWTSSGFLPFSAAGLLDENGVLLNPARTLEETQQFLERTVNSGKKWPVSLKGESELASQPCAGSKIKQYSIPLPGFRNSGQSKLPGLMEKNNISVPPDCTTKVVGFKMVDGKKHLILKVVPSAKSDVSPDAGKEVSTGLNPVEFNSIGSEFSTERPSDQTCPELGNTITKNSLFLFCDATSSSGEKQSEKQPEDPTAPQVDNTENDCNKGSRAFTEISSAPPQLAVSGTEEDFNVAIQKNTEKQLMSPGVMSDSHNTHHLNEVVANISVEISSLRKADIQTLNANIQNVEHTKKRTDSQEKAVEDLTENRPELTTSQNDSGCHGDLASSIPSDLDSLEEGFQSQLSGLMSEEDRSSNVDLINVDMKSGEDSPVMQSPLLPLNEQKMVNMPSSAVSYSPTTQEKEAIFEPNINPTVISLQKHTTEPPFNSPGEDGGLLFQDSGDEYTNNVDPRDAPVPSEQSCTTETVEEPNCLAILSLGDSCHNADLYQTLEELPVTTISHLLDDPEVTSRGVTHQSEELGSLSTQHVGLQSPKAIPVAATVATGKNSTQSNVCLPPANEPAMKRKRQGQPTTHNSQVPSKSRKQLVQNSQEKDPPASIPYWEPIPEAEERTLRLLPVCSSQPIKVPRLNQPVIVLNHPDTDIPEVVNIMRIVHKHKGAVQKVVLSQGTLKALSELSCDPFRKSLGTNCHSSHYRRAWPQGTVKERFILKLKLKRLCGNKYEVTPSASKTNRYQSTFRCWFCGRLFKNQEAWVGHGQRHLMEATRDWNKLFNGEGQCNSPIQPYFH